MKNEHCNIRLYKSEDLAQLMSLISLNIPKYFADSESADFKEYLENEIEKYYVLEMNGVLIGCGGINYLEDGTKGRISWDMMHPDHQKKGYGSELLLHRLDILKSDKNIRIIEVRTSQMSYGFYEKHGFKIINTIDNYWAPGYHLYEMTYSDALKINKC